MKLQWARLRLSLVALSTDKWKIDKSAGQASSGGRRRVCLGLGELGQSS